MLAVHGRFASETRRRQGAANLEAIRRIREALTIPVVSNGNIRNYSEAVNNLAFTGAAGVMSGEGILADPSIFSGSEAPANPPALILLARQYLDLCSLNPPPVRWASHHLLHIFEQL